MAMDTSYLTTQVNTIIGQLHGIFDEIGVPRNEREARETELFTALSETLHNHLRLVNSEKTKLTEEAYKIIETIKQMEASLDDTKSNEHYAVEDDALRVSYPLNRCLHGLKEKFNTVSKLHRERFEQVKKLVEALESYSSHLESSFVKIALPPTNSATCPPNFDLSPSYVAKLDTEFTKVYEEYSRRVAFVSATAEDIVKLYAELGTPQAQTDSNIVACYRESPEQLGLHQSDINNLKNKKEKLIEEKKSRERRVKELRAAVEGLWDRLGVEEPDRKAFLAANRGCGLRTINEFEDELGRLNELKRQNLHLFVEDARCRLQELWDGLYFSEEEMLDFTPAFSDVYSDALLSAHESEITRLEALKEQRAPTLALVDKHRSLIKDRDDLAATANDASRLMLKPAKGEKRDPGKLLREEKMRKRIAKELPKVEAELRKTLEAWEEEYGRPFLVHGERYLDEMEIVSAKAPPPRSKTPNGLPPRAKTPAGPPPSSAKPSRANSQSSTAPRPQSRAATVNRGAVPSSTTRTPTGTLRRNAAALKPAASAQTSPSKIPSRVPLGNLKHGGNSPERRIPGPQTNNASNSNTFRKMGPPPARPPPPKMRDLFVPPNDQTPMVGYQQHPPPPRPQSAVSSSSSNTSLSNNGAFVRPMSPEDPYDDRVERMSYMSASMINHGNTGMNGINRPLHASQSYHEYHPGSRQGMPDGYPSAPPSRQISNTSGSTNLTTATTTSGSENWETLDDNSEISSEQMYSQPQSSFHPSHSFQGQRPMASHGTATIGMKRPYVLDGGAHQYLQQQHQQQSSMPPPPHPAKMRANMNMPKAYMAGGGGVNTAVVEVVGEDGRHASVSEAGWTDDTNDY